MPKIEELKLNKLGESLKESKNKCDMDPFKENVEELE